MPDGSSGHGSSVARNNARDAKSRLDGERVFGDRPRFSTLTSPPRGNFVCGADWPEWQRNLYPVTYQSDREAVLRRLEAQLAEVARARSQMFKALRRGDRRTALTYRDQLAKHLGYVRNCETQLRLIAATGAYLASQKEAA